MIKNYNYMFNMMFHPIEGAEEVAWSKKGSMPLALLILFVWVLTSIIEIQCGGTAFRIHHKTELLNILMIMVSTILMFILWVTSNWSFCTLLDGKGTYKDIWVISAYALLPSILFSLGTTFISNFLILDEGIFLEWITYIGKGWSIILLLMGLMTAHRYSLKKTIWSALLTILGIVIIVFLTLLLFSLFQQVYVFVATVISELMYRY